MLKHSYTVEGRTYTACIECNRGINGAAENKCSSGGLETDERLACWCGEDDPCHGDVVLELANRTEEKQI